MVKEFNKNDFEQQMLTVDLYRANVFALLLMLVMGILYGLPYVLLHGFNYSNMLIVEFARQVSPLLLALLPLVAILAGTALHELIHGLVWAFFAEKGFRSVRFGLLLKMLTPYCHCKEPLKIKHYRLGAWMPAVLLGFVPAVAGILAGKMDLLIFGWFFTGAAAGDFLIIHLLRKEARDDYALDHPSEAGCWVFRKKERNCKD